MTADPFGMLRPVGEPCPVRAAFARAETIDPFDRLRPVPPEPRPVRKRPSPPPSKTPAQLEAERRRAEEELERLIFHMTGAARNAATEWQRRFAAGMAEKGRRRGWRPTTRQRAAMAQIVAEMFGEDGAELIEEEEGRNYARR